jgi:hypothetical protein
MCLLILVIGKVEVLATSHWYEVPNSKIFFEELYKPVHRTVNCIVCNCLSHPVGVHSNIRLLQTVSI